jgi:hypothetical protein
MHDNGEKNPHRSRSQLPCIFCGLVADLDHDDLIVELRGNPSSYDAMPQVWHRRCYNDFLDQGEET